MSFRWRYAALSVLIFAFPVFAQIVTSQYDNLRTGANLKETILTPKNVNTRQFGKLGTWKVDGPVYAQPLYVPNLDIPGKGRHNVLYVATEHDTVYAFDADRPGEAPLWQVSFLDSKRSIEPVQGDEVQCPFLRPDVGITSTPVIDVRTGTLFVLARTRVYHRVAANDYMQHLHALAITTGGEKFGGPKLIQASVPGKGAGGSGGQIAFDALHENPRASLLLVNGNVILTWASSCDVDPYHGWVMAYDAQTLAQKAVLNVTPDGTEGGIWASDTGPAADASGNIFVPTGNGTFSAASGGRDYGDSVLKLDPSTLAIRDYFTPFDEKHLNDEDLDVGSSGPTLLPDQPGPHPHLLLQPTKGGMIYLLDRDRLGKFQRNGNATLQQFRAGQGGYGAMAYWNGHAFFVADRDFLRDYGISSGKLTEIAKATTPLFENPGATPAVSANGTRDAIVWVIATRTWNGRERPAVLYAYDASRIDKPIYSSEENAARDRASLATRFVVPVVVNGRVYFGTRDEVEVYGLLK
jgi:outer membrane protein assembly factor BamB